MFSIYIIDLGIYDDLDCLKRHSYEYWDINGNISKWQKGRDFFKDFFTFFSIPSILWNNESKKKSEKKLSALFSDFIPLCIPIYIYIYIDNLYSIWSLAYPISAIKSTIDVPKQ